MANPQTLTLKLPDLSNRPQTFVSTDYTVSGSGTALTVKNTQGFAANDYIVLGKLGTEQAEIVQISSVTNSTAIVLTAAAKFNHAADSVVTYIPYNKFRVYRSTTGVGGSYVLLSEANMQVDAADLKNKYYDATATSPYSYKFSFYNSTSTVESSFSDEIPFTGYTDYMLKSMQDAVLELFGDPNEETITRTMVTYWLNEFHRKLQVIATGGDTPLFVTNTTITSTGAQSYSLSSYDIVNLFLVELSTDGGSNYTQTVDPADARFMTNAGATSMYTYKIMGETMLVNGTIPSGYVMRLWYFTTPESLTDPTDELLTPFIPLVDMYINHALMRAHEKDRQIERADYYRAEIRREFRDSNSVINRIKTRVKQGNKTMATTWADDMGMGVW